MSKVELSDPIAIRIPVELLADVEKVAGAIDRTRSWVLVRALKLYLAGEGGEVLSLIAAREQNAVDGGHDADDVIKELTALLSDTKAA